VTEIGRPEPEWTRYLLSRLGLATAKQEVIAASLLADPWRSLQELADATGMGKRTVYRVRRKLEGAGVVAAYHAPSRVPPSSMATMRELLATDPSRTNRAIVRLSGGANRTVFDVRHQMEDAREICVWRGGAHDDECWCKLEP
jgi:hypothetical protein